MGALRVNATDVLPTNLLTSVQGNDAYTPTVMRAPTWTIPTHAGNTSPEFPARLHAQFIFTMSPGFQLLSKAASVGP
jgi:hypothetical protein